ncbi:MAG: hypothetical protein ACXW4H_06775 [Candidatus Limnocylindrales bacterium]
MTRIEYRVEELPSEEISRADFLAKLNELGKEGWRLVAVNPLERVTGGWVPSKPVPMLLMREVTE